MESAGTLISQGAIVWFIVMMVRAWLPREAREWIDGPARVWGLVFIAASIIVLLNAGGWSGVEGDLSGHVLEALALAITAIGIDSVQYRIPQVAAELNFNIGDRTGDEDAPPDDDG